MQEIFFYVYIFEVDYDLVVFCWSVGHLRGPSCDKQITVQLELRKVLVFIQRTWQQHAIQQLGGV